VLHRFVAHHHHHHLVVCHSACRVVS
jgi:hypothetical protein